MRPYAEARSAPSVGADGEPSAARPHVAQSRDGAVDLSWLAANLWRRRALIVVAGVLSGAVALGVNILRPPIYEAAATLLVARAAGTDDKPDAPVNMQTFLVLIQSRTVAQKVVEELKLVTGRSFTSRGSETRMTPGQFLADVLQVQQLAGANLIRLRIRLGDPVLAARVANRVAEESIALNRRVNQQQVVVVRDLIKTQLDEAERRLDESKRALLAYQSSAQIDALRADVDAALGQRSKLLGILADEAAERARLAAAQNAIENRQRFVTTRRSIDRDPALMEAARRADAPSQVGALGLSLEEQSVDQVFQDLELQAAHSRADLAAFESRRREITGDKGLDAVTAPLLSRLYDREAHLARLDLEAQLAESIYSELTNRYEQSRLEVASRNNEMQLVDPALPPPGRVSPTVALNTMLAGALGLIAAVFAVIAVAYLHPRAA